VADGYDVRRDRLLFVDLELTCWENGIAPAGQSSEIIEIGIVEVDAPSLSITRTASFLVKPTRSEVSGFCTALTGITSTMLRSQGRPFAETCRLLERKWGTGGKAWMSWGPDRRAVDAACEIEGVASPFSQSFHDLGTLFSLAAGRKRGIGQTEAMEAFGLTRTGRIHSGEADAIALAELWMAAAAAARLVLEPPEPVAPGF
jgi:inhibitor of KinA sporulation pathway (predicted exonuclease)